MLSKDTPPICRSLKIVIFIVVLVVLSILVSGCGDCGGHSTNPRYKVTIYSKQHTILKVYHAYDIYNISGSRCKIKIAKNSWMCIEGTFKVDKYYEKPKPSTNGSENNDWE